MIWRLQLTGLEAYLAAGGTRAALEGLLLGRGVTPGSSQRTEDVWQFEAHNYLTTKQKADVVVTLAGIGLAAEWLA